MMYFLGVFIFGHGKHGHTKACSFSNPMINFMISGFLRLHGNSEFEIKKIY